MSIAIELDANERKTRELFHAFNVYGKGDEYVYIKAVFCARYQSAFDAEAVFRIGSAMYERALDDDLREATKKALTALVKAKVLRSYQDRQRDIRYYEVNY